MPLGEEILTGEATSCRSATSTKTSKTSTRTTTSNEARHQQRQQQQQQHQAIIMCNTFVCACASTGASFYTNVTPFILPAAVGHTLPSRNSTFQQCKPSKMRRLFLHKENLSGAPIISQRLAPSISLAPRVG